MSSIQDCPNRNNPYYNSGHQIPGYPQYLTPYIIDLIQEYDQYEKQHQIPFKPIHRRLTYKEFLVYQRFLSERTKLPTMSMGPWIKDPFA